jgi:predicted RNA-binding protein with PIN domain
MSEEPVWDGPLPDAVRSRVVTFAAGTLGALAEDEVPGSLKRFRSWAPQHRRTRAGTPLAAAVDRDVTFRQRVAAAAREELPDLAAALDAGEPPPAADPVDVAAVAYLARTPGWAALVAAAAAEAERASAQAGSEAQASEVARLEAALAAEQTRHAEQLAALKAELAAATAEAASATKALREEKGARRRAERVAAEAAESVLDSLKASDAAAAAAAEEVRRARAKVDEAEAALTASRRATREGRSLEDSRVRLLLDTVVESAGALRRELALPPVSTRPADHVEGAAPGDRVVGGDAQALLSDDPALLDQLLSLPQVHLIVDGYNVTKTGYPDLSLEKQRTRLLMGLSNLAARCGAEVTCCFDGAALEGRVPAVSARGVRVLFSKAGETADELIRRLVRAEPTGRPVCVVSSDREVADGVRRSGARPVSAVALVRRLDRA